MYVTVTVILSGRSLTSHKRFLQCMTVTCIGHETIMNSKERPKNDMWRNAEWRNAEFPRHFLELKRRSLELGTPNIFPPLSVCEIYGIALKNMRLLG